MSGGTGLIASARLATALTRVQVPLTRFHVRADVWSVNMRSRWIGGTQITFQRAYNSPGRRAFTAAFHSHVSLIENYSQFLSKFPFIKSVHNMTPLFFLNMYIKNKKLKKKNPYCAGMLPIFHILHDPCILLVLFLKGMVSIDVSCHSKKKKKGLISFP